MLSLWLLLASLVLSAYGAGQVWLVQLSSYPLWRLVGPAELRAYHAAWWRSIWGVVLAPAALTCLGALLMIWLRPPHVAPVEIWLGAGLQAALVLGTAVWWGPLMARLEARTGGLDPERYSVLLGTHWLRVAIVTAYALLVAWMTAQALGAVGGSFRS
jgi:hypothetical protein